jgi:NAD(P)-dependent dehydrogenase (short-subunit alcohol dehydrogenase family)
MCPSCAELNYKKRYQLADLTGKIAVVTGGRIKIGFETCAILLRSGCFVIATTRFPKDAYNRYKQLPDFDVLKSKLRICHLELRNSQSITNFVDHIKRDYGRLDILINNAAQTIHRPQMFYKRLSEVEENLVLEDNSIIVQSKNEILSVADTGITNTTTETDDNTLTTIDETLFPDQVDENAIQVDLRSENTWTTPLHKTNLSELVDVTVINYLAPFILIQQLYPLFVNNPKDTFIINVSAMEGKFNCEDSLKRDTHVHTNGAKAALNMITRSIGEKWRLSHIYVNSVDTGWVTNEYPIGVYRVNPPLDEIDGAARILDPILTHINTCGKVSQYGVFFKDYIVTDW